MYKKVTIKLKALSSLMRLDKPVGILLLLLPTLSAFFVLTKGQPTIHLLAIFLIGTVFMRSAGCVINDYFDREIDGSVERTKDRPIVTGLVSPNESLLLFFALVLVSAALLFFTNLLTFFVALIGVLITLIYPLTKRFFSIPQVFLGFAFSWGIVMVSSAELNTITTTTYTMFFACFFWILAYDTIYAMCDKVDDALLEINSAALTFGNKVWHFILIFHLFSLAMWLLIGWTEQLSLGFYVCIVLALLLVAYQMYLIKDYDRAKCLAAFKNNTWVGFVLFLGCVSGTLL